MSSLTRVTCTRTHLQGGFNGMLRSKRVMLLPAEYFTSCLVDPGDHQRIQRKLKDRNTSENAELTGHGSGLCVEEQLQSLLDLWPPKD